jgi:hypothetical protein
MLHSGTWEWPGDEANPSASIILCLSPERGCQMFLMDLFWSVEKDNIDLYNVQTSSA